MYNRIEQEVAEYFGISPESIRSSSMKRVDTQARHYVWYILYYIFGFKAAAIAYEYGVTRQLVHHSVKQVHEWIRLYPDCAETYSDIMNRLKDITDPASMA